MTKTSSVGKSTNTFSSSPWAICLCLALCFVVDAGIAVMLILAQVNSWYFALPLAAAVVDVVFFIVALSSNFRFRYALGLYVVYTVAYALLCLATAFRNIAQQNVVMTRWALALWVLVHIVGLIVTLIAYIYSAKLPKTSKLRSTLIIAIALVVLAVLTGLYGYQYMDNGYFGQGNEGVIRPLLYSYNNDYNTYSVVGVLDGKGDTVVIPESFNGRTVQYVDCSVFSAANINTVSFTGKVNYNFTNIQELRYRNSNVQLVAEKDNIDDVKKAFYRVGADNAQYANYAFETANSITPSNIGDNQVYVTFAYSAESYSLFDGNVIPTWYGNKGDVFYTDKYEQEFEFFNRRDVNSDEDLHWNYIHSDGYIFTGLNVNGQSLENMSVDCSYDAVPIQFDRIYCVFVNEDNDTVYETPDSYTKSFVNGSYLDYKYTVASNANTIVDNIPSRKGFALSWQYSQESYSDKFDLTELSSVLSQGNNDIVYLYPTWTMFAPTVQSIHSNAANNSVMYGESVSFEVDAEAYASEFDLSYSWSNGFETWTTSTFSIDSIPFEWSGAYTCVVTSSSSESSLTAQSVATLPITVTQRKVALNWDVNSLNWIDVDGVQTVVYSGYDQRILLSFSDGDIINNDATTWYLDSSSGNFASTRTNYDLVLHNAGNYHAEIALVGSDVYKYILVQGSTYDITIDKAQVVAEWDALDGKTYEYNDGSHQPFATVSGVGLDGALQLSVTPSGENVNTDYGIVRSIDAGYYVANLTLTNDANNYTVVNPTLNYQITPAVLYIDEWTGASFTYNNTEQRPKVNRVSGYVASQYYALLDYGFKYSITPKDRDQTEGIGVFAGSYTVTAQLVDYDNGFTNYRFSNNYVVYSGGSKDYEIEKLDIEIQWNNNSFEYIGNKQSPVVTDVFGAVYGETAQLVANGFTYDGMQQNVGTGYVATAVLTDVEYFSTNYNVVNPNYTYEITKAYAFVHWTQTDFVYSGTEQIATYACQGKGLDGELTLTVTSDKPSIDVDTYTALAYFSNDIDENNYALIGVSTEYRITKRNITLVWSDDALVYNGRAQAPIIVSIENAVSDHAETLIYALNDTVVYDGNVDVNRYTVEAALELIPYGNFSNNYTIEYGASNSYYINPLEVAVVWTGSDNEFDFVYNGEAQWPIAKATGVDDIDLVLKLTTESGYPVNFGDYVAIATLENNDINRNYTLANIVQQFHIVKREISLVWDFAYGSEFIYNGYEQTPFVVSIGNVIDKDTESLVNALNNTLQYASHVDVASYGVTAVLDEYIDGIAANYVIRDGSDINVYSIVPKHITVTWNYFRDFIYDGDIYNAPFPSSVDLCRYDTLFRSFESLSDVQLVDGYAVNAGNYRETAYHHNYILDNDTVEFVIQPRTISLHWSIGQLVYNGQAQTPTVLSIDNVVSTDKDALLVSLNASLANYNNVNANSYTVNVLLSDSNYQITDGSEMTSYNISPLTIYVQWIAPIQSVPDLFYYSYNGEAQVPKAMAIGVDDTMLSLTITVLEGSAVNYGYYTAQASLDDNDVNSNYTIANDMLPFMIIRRVITLVWSIDNGGELVYNGQPQAPTIVSIDRIVEKDYERVLMELSDSIDYSLNVDVNTYTVRAVLNDNNYSLADGSESITYAITPLAVDVIWTGNTDGSFNYVFDGRTHAPTAKAIGVNGAEIGISVNVEGSEPLSVGKYVITAGLIYNSTTNSHLNYTLTNPVQQFDITPCPISLVWGVDGVAGVSQFVYNGQAQTPSVIAIDGGTDIDHENIQLLLEFNSQLGSFTNINVNTYTVTVENYDTNYTVVGGASCTYSIVPKQITVAWTNIDPVTYDARNHSPEVTSDQLCGDDKLTLTLTNANGETVDMAVNSGVYVATANNPNYLIDNAVQTFEILKRQLSFAVTSDALIVTDERPAIEDIAQYLNLVLLDGELITTQSIKAEYYYVSDDIEDDNYWTVSAHVTVLFKDSDRTENYNITVADLTVNRGSNATQNINLTKHSAKKEDGYVL